MKGSGLSVSVVIPAYRASAFLETAVRSVQAQTRPAHEIIVVDDESPDDTFALAQRLGAIALRTGVNGGPAKARNTGAQAATGDVLAFLDADDYWDADHLEVIAGLAERFPDAGVFFTNVRIVGGLGGERRTDIAEGVALDVSAEIPLRNCVPQTTSAVRRALFEGVGGYDQVERLSEDYDLWLRMSRITKFACTHKVTGNYRVHDGQLTSDPARANLARAQTRVRARMLQRLVAEGAPDVPAFRRAALQAWETLLEEAWYYGDQLALDAALEAGELVEGSSEARARWTQRRQSLRWQVRRPAARFKRWLDAVIASRSVRGRAWAPLQ